VIPLPVNLDVQTRSDQTRARLIALPPLPSTPQMPDYPLPWHHRCVGAHVGSQDLYDGQLIVTLQTDSITVNVEAVGGYILNIGSQTARVLTANVPASNGIVHIISAVLCTFTDRVVCCAVYLLSWGWGYGWSWGCHAAAFGAHTQCRAPASCVWVHVCGCMCVDACVWMHVFGCMCVWVHVCGCMYVLICVGAFVCVSCVYVMCVCAGDLCCAGCPAILLRGSGCVVPTCLQCRPARRPPATLCSWHKPRPTCPPS
jgi:hypothetical protein